MVSPVLKRPHKQSALKEPKYIKMLRYKDTALEVAQYHLIKDLVVQPSGCLDQIPSDAETFDLLDQISEDTQDLAHEDFLLQVLVVTLERTAVVH